MRPKKVILCVDDDNRVLSIRRFLLQNKGYRVLSAASGDIALEILREGGVDLLLTDLVMPVMTGRELIRRAKVMQRGLPAILISGSVKTYDANSLADAFLPKGSNSPIELLERIRLLIARKRGPKPAPRQVATQDAVTA